MATFDFELPASFTPQDIEDLHNIYRVIYGDRVQYHLDQLKFQSDILDRIIAPEEYVAGGGFGGYSTHAGFQTHKKKLMYSRTLAQVGFLPFEHPTFGYHKDYKFPEEPGEQFKPRGHFMICWDVSASNLAGDLTVNTPILGISYTKVPIINMELLCILMLLQEAKSGRHKVSLLIHTASHWNWKVMGTSIAGNLSFGTRTITRYVDLSKFGNLEIMGRWDHSKYTGTTKDPSSPNAKGYALGPFAWETLSGKDIHELFSNGIAPVFADRVERLDGLIENVAAIDEEAICRGTEDWECAPLVYRMFKKSDTLARGTLFIFTDFGNVGTIVSQWSPYFYKMAANCNIILVHVLLGMVAEPGESIPRGYKRLSSFCTVTVRASKAIVTYPDVKAQTSGLMMEVLEDIDDMILEILTSEGTIRKNLTHVTAGYAEILPRNPPSKTMEPLRPYTPEHFVEVRLHSLSGNKGKVRIRELSSKLLQQELFKMLRYRFCPNCKEPSSFYDSARVTAAQYAAGLNPMDIEQYLRLEDHLCPLCNASYNSAPMMPGDDIVKYVAVSDISQMPFLVVNALESSAGYEKT